MGIASSQNMDLALVTRWLQAQQGVGADYNPNVAALDSWLSPYLKYGTLDMSRVPEIAAAIRANDPNGAAEISGGWVPGGSFAGAPITSVSGGNVNFDSTANTGDLLGDLILKGAMAGVTGLGISDLLGAGVGYAAGAGGEGALSAAEFAANAGAGQSLPAWAQPMAGGVADTGFGAGTTPGTTLADYAANAEATDLLQGQTMLNNAGINYSDILGPAAAAVGGAAGAAAAAGGGGAAAGGATGTGLTLGNAASGASLAATAAAAGGGGDGTGSGYNVDGTPTGMVGGDGGGGGTGADTSTVDGSGGTDGGGAVTSVLGGAGTLSNIAQWAKDNPALLKALGTGAGGILGYIQSNRQADQLKSLSDQYAGYGAPSRARYEATYQPGFTMASDPGFTDALNQASKATMHSLSVNGNPAGSPNAWAQSLADNTAKFAYPALQTYRSQNANSGGISTFNAASPELATGAITAQGQGTNSLGKAAANIFSPAQPTSLADILKLYGQGSGNIFGAAA